MADRREQVKGEGYLYPLVLAPVVPVGFSAVGLEVTKPVVGVVGDFFS
jgi:hypothetical protein